MTMTKIKTFIHQPHWTLLFVKIETDEGISGWGEATTQGQEKDVEASIHNLAEYLIGKDPRQIELHWSTMFRNSYWRPTFIVTTAMSGLEIAMWDILGKSLDVPVYQLLGGPCRERIKIYRNGWWFAAKSLDDYVELARKEVEGGAKALKWDPFWGCDVFSTRDEIRQEAFPAMKDEFIELPTKPGLGVEINEKALERTKKPYVYHDLSGFWASPRQPSAG